MENHGIELLGTHILPHILFTSCKVILTMHNVEKIEALNALLYHWSSNVLYA